MTPTHELKRLAEEATPGPWRSIIDDTGGQWSGWPLCIVPENGDDRSIVRTGGMWPYKWDAKVSQHEAVSTAAYIAAANPARVLQIIEENERLREHVRHFIFWAEEPAEGAPGMEREQRWLSEARQALGGQSHE